jgi:hypothetical protein
MIASPVNWQALHDADQELARETPAEEPGFHLKIWHVLGVALLLRGMLPIAGYYHTGDVGVFYNPDSHTYIEPARELIANHRFFANGAPEFTRTPGYPLLLTLGLLSAHLVATTILIQILLSCFTVYMVYRTALLVFEHERAALMAAVLYGIEPLSIFYSSQLLTETTFTALMIVGIYYLLTYVKEQSLRHLIFSAIALAASIYVRPIAEYLPVILAIALSVWALWYKQATKTRILVHAICFLLVSSALTVPWRVRNLMETGYSGFAGISSVNRYFYLATSVLAAQRHLGFFEMQRQSGYLDNGVYLDRHPEQRTWTEGERLEYLDESAENILAHNRLTYLKIHLLGVVRVMLDPGATPFLEFFGLYRMGGGLFGKILDAGSVKAMSGIAAREPMVLWSNLALLPLLLLDIWCALLAIFSRGRRWNPCMIALLLTAAYFVTISGGPAGLGRFRHPVMPILCVLAGYGFMVGREETPATARSKPGIILSYRAGQRTTTEPALRAAARQ